MKKKKEEYRICWIYDTETCNYKIGSDEIAYPILFIFNDLTGTTISTYQYDEDDEVRFIRSEKEAIEYIDQCVEYGKTQKFVPVIAAYNLMFDMQPLMEDLHSKYSMTINAQSSTSAYTIDILDENGNKLLRFWDTFFLDPRGLAKMGETCGLEKASGSWNYDLIRTPETELTDEELYYARRDVQVIPAYLKFLIESEDYIEESDLGGSLITKTSIVRLFSKRVIGELQCGSRTVRACMTMLCNLENAKTYESYATRKAQFRGGLTFTSARYASTTLHNVLSLDITSAHHAYINGRVLPVKFKKYDRGAKNAYRILNKIKNTDLKQVLRSYHMPFNYSFNACIKFDNLRLKKGSAFEVEGIAILSEAKVYSNGIERTFTDPRNYIAEIDVRSNGYQDKVLNETAAYSKIEAADIAYIWCNEIEFWNICQVYSFDDFEWITGEMTCKFDLPPDYITLTSNYLYKRKNEMKKLVKTYDETPYKNEISDLIPKAIADQCYEGTAKKRDLEAYYNIIIKGMFNAIYGSQAQNVNKPSYTIAEDTHDIIIDAETRKNSINFEANKSPLVNYIYGSRIVAGSRMQLVIAIMLLKEALGERIHIAGGDTDSLKIGTDEDVSNEEVMECLKPLHRAIREAINTTQRRVRENYPEYASDLEEIGEFEIENNGERYVATRDYWNKCRMSLDKNGSFHITCAGVSRPSDKYNLEDIANRMLEIGIDYEDIFDTLIGYNTTYYPSVSFLLAHKKPKYCDKVNEEIIDYRGKKSIVKCHQSISLYPASKTIGDECSITNYCNIIKKKKLHQNIRTDQISIYQDENNVYIGKTEDIFEYTLLYEIPKQ